MKDKSHELAYLASLLADFPVKPNLNAEQAIIIIQTRYTVLLRNPSAIIELLRLPESSEKIIRSFLPRMLHAFLYWKILNNAGTYRQVSEPNGGVVFFGLEQQFSGTRPLQIEAEIDDIFAQLRPNSPDPVLDIAKFYQRFVQIHPFYDANGRIGRAIVMAYLDLHDLYMNWEAMEKNDKWLKRLNHCHKRYATPSYETYLAYHVEHWRKFIVPKSQIYSELEPDMP